MTASEMLNSYGQLTMDKLTQFVPNLNDAQQKLRDAMLYSLEAGGKRIRPALLLECYRLCGGNPINALPAACAIEMIHTYSLIHDDLPCMDNDELRRGKPSCHIAFGEGMALLAGDALQGEAFLALFKMNSVATSEDIIKAAELLAKANSSYGIVGGQAIDMMSETSTVDIKSLQLMHELKTATLLVTAAQMGAVLAGANSEQLEAITKYAKAIGLAFQIIDDIMDVTSSTEQMGKPSHSDQSQNKGTYVTLYGLEKSREMASDLTQAAIKEISTFKGSESLIDLAVMLQNRQN